MKWTSMTKYLSIPDYLEYQKIIEDGKESHLKELDEFFISHDLPSLKDIKEQNLRVYLSQDVAVNIYNVDEMKKDHVLITEKVG